jgi:hypothetical protein
MQISVIYYYVGLQLSCNSAGAFQHKPLVTVGSCHPSQSILFAESSHRSRSFPVQHAQPIQIRTAGMTREASASTLTYPNIQTQKPKTNGRNMQK